MRIMLVISSLRRGGAERVMSAMANYWAIKGHEVFLVTVENNRADTYSLNSRVHRIALNLARTSRNPLCGLWNNLRRVQQLRFVARKVQAEVVISFMTHTNLLVLLALLGSGLPAIVSERVDPSQVTLGYVRQCLRNWLYPRAAVVVVQTERALDFMQRRLRAVHFAVIPNAIPQDNPDNDESQLSLRELAQIPVGAKIIAAMGRLDCQKGFDLLVEAFGKLSDRYPMWRLVILGEGASRPALAAQVSRLGLTAHVRLPGLVKDARRCLAEADLFVLSSRYEGFPNALLEAMSSGLPVVSFDCASGPAEIIRSGRDGLLVEAGNIMALSETMSQLMESPDRRDELGKNARQVLERFSMDRIMTLWDRLAAGVILSDATLRVRNIGPRSE